MCWCYEAIFVANGNPSFRDEHTACKRILKISKKLQLKLSVIVQSITYICSYVCIASTECRYGSTGFVYVITERSIL